MTKRFKLFIVSLSSALLAILLLGSVLAKSSAADGDAYRHFSVFTDVVSRIKSDYVEEPDMKNVTLGALNGLLEAIDPYASYLNADQYKQYVKTKEAKKAHVGLVLSRRFGYVSVVDAIPGSPADKQGITTGDVLETINNVSTRDMPLAFADFLLHGDAGTSIEMAVIRVRKGTDAQKISLVRADIPTPTIESKMLADGVGYVQIHSLEPGQAKAAATKLSDLEKQGAKRFVVDLRDCVLGQPEEGYAFANMFLDKGLMGYLMGQKVARKDFQADPTKVVFRQPTVLVTNRGAANGAEVAASALLENKRAEVVGERTYGDAAQRKAITLDDGGAVILAVAKYYSPGGKAIQDVAVTPSLPVAEAGAPTGDSDDDGAAAAPNTPEKKSGEDLQLKKAIEVVTVGLAAAKKSGVEPAAAAKGPATAPAPALGPLNVPRPKQ